MSDEALKACKKYSDGQAKVIKELNESLRGNKLMLKRVQELGLNAELFRHEIRTLIMGEEGEWG